jgi:hypothetical protein
VWNELSEYVPYSIGGGERVCFPGSATSAFASQDRDPGTELIEPNDYTRIISDIKANTRFDKNGGFGNLPTAWAF